jgi:hypothetical protein
LALSKEDVNMVRIFDGRILRKIYGPVKIMVYGDQDTVVRFIPLAMNRT